MQTTAQDLIERAAKYDPALAADIRAFAKAREFGLVFEHNRPEAMRLYGKKVSRGDTVHVLPPRGKAETSDNKVMWHVDSISRGQAKLSRVDAPDKVAETAVENLVAVAAFEDPIYAGLRETGRVERGGGVLGDPGDKPYHVVINGENYHALEALLFAYAGKVDCIYIDPPYNTGARDWKYNNDYVDATDEYRHSKWLAFMERRLRLAKHLLNPLNSVLICTIDEKEYLRLGLLINDVFDDASNIQMITAVTNPSGSSRAKTFARAGEYIFIVFMGAANLTRARTDMLHEARGPKEIQWEGYIRRGATRLRTDRPNMFYPIYFSKEDGHFEGFGDVVPLEADYRKEPVPEGCFAVWPVVGSEERYWRLGKESSEKIYKDGFLKFGPWKKGSKKRAVYYLPEGTRTAVENGEIEIIGRAEEGSVVLSAVERDVIPFDIWNRPSHSAADYGTPLLGKMIPGHKFPFPKSLYAVEDTIRFFLANKPNALVLDFFSGSGTTAHAVMRLNHRDNGNRRCISITNNEVSEAEAKKLTRQGLRQGDSDWEALGICEYVTKPRIKAAITGLTPNGTPIKGDYKFTDEFSMADGFNENAVFFDLTYQNPVVVDLDGAYEEVAPLLWMRAGCKGPIIESRGDGTYEIAETYGILFDYAFAQEYIAALEARPEVQTVYVVTDDEGRYQSINQALKGRDVVQLYESYLRSFGIAAEGALR